MTAEQRQAIQEAMQFMYCARNFMQDGTHEIALLDNAIDQLTKALEIDNETRN